MTKALHIAAFVLVPLAWGLLVDYAFERLRRRTRRKASDSAADEVIE